MGKTASQILLNFKKEEGEGEFLLRVMLNTSFHLQEMYISSSLLGFHCVWQVG